MYYSKMLYDYKYDTKELWKQLRPKIAQTKDKSSMNNEMLIDDIEQKDSVLISNAYCKYFTNVGKGLANKIPQANKQKSCYISLEGHDF